MKLSQIDALRKQGWKIKVTHFRYVTDFQKVTPGNPPQLDTFWKLMERRAIDLHNKGEFAHLPLTICPCGGRVKVELESPDGKQCEGWSECSVLDNFTRKIGTAMAFGRAMKEWKKRYEPV